MKTHVRLIGALIACFLFSSCAPSGDLDSGLLGGTAQPNFSEGDPGEVSVIQTGAPVRPGSSTSVPFAFKNNTDEGISLVTWTATARSGGAIVATGQSIETTPVQIPPGEVGLAFIYFSGGEIIPDDAEYEFTVEHFPAGTDTYDGAQLKVTESTVEDGAVVGTAINDTGLDTEGPYKAVVYCFDGDSLLAEHNAFLAERGPLGEGDPSSFTVDLKGNDCPSFIVGVSGKYL